MSDNIKLKKLLVSQIEYSDNLRLNIEKTLNRIKDEFRIIVKEWEILKKKSNNKEDNNSSNSNNINCTNLLISGIGIGNSGNKNRINSANNSNNNSNNNPNNQNSNINPINKKIIVLVYHSK